MLRRFTSTPGDILLAMWALMMKRNPGAWSMEHGAGVEGEQGKEQAYEVGSGDPESGAARGDLGDTGKSLLAA